MDDGQFSPLRIDDTDQTLAGAYEGIGIKDPSIPDGDVVAAFHTAYLQETRVSDINNFDRSKHCRSYLIVDSLGSSNSSSRLSHISPRIMCVSWLERLFRFPRQAHLRT